MKSTETRKSSIFSSIAKYLFVSYFVTDKLMHFTSFETKKKGIWQFVIYSISLAFFAFSLWLILLAMMIISFVWIYQSWILALTLAGFINLLLIMLTISLLRTAKEKYFSKVENFKSMLSNLAGSVNEFLK